MISIKNINEIFNLKNSFNLIFTKRFLNNINNNLNKEQLQFLNDFININLNLKNKNYIIIQFDSSIYSNSIINNENDYKLFLEDYIEYFINIIYDYERNFNEIKNELKSIDFNIDYNIKENIFIKFNFDLNKLNNNLNKYIDYISKVILYFLLYISDYLFFIFQLNEKNKKNKELNIKENNIKENNIKENFKSFKEKMYEQFSVYDVFPDFDNNLDCNEYTKFKLIIQNKNDYLSGFITILSDINKNVFRFILSL